jgi:hypothetical protein
MSSRHFLYLTNARLVSLATRRGRIIARREFAASGAGAAEFDRSVAGMSDVMTYLFTDLAEEDFRLDTIPHVGGRDRDAILTRKLAQIFRSTPYRYALTQGRENEGRRDDRVLYTAIANAEVMRPWVDVIERHRIPLAGIYSAAIFSGALLEELDLVFPHALLVTFTPGNSMRQTYVRDGEIKFSRVTPVDLEEGQSLGAMVAEETTRTWQYLDSLRHFTQDDRLEVCVLVHPTDRATIEPALRDFAQIQYRLLDIEQVATKLGLKSVPLDSTADEIFVHLFLIRKTPNHYASAELRRHATLLRTRRLIGRVAIAALVVSIGWGGWNLSRVFETSAEDDKVAQQLHSFNREYEQIARALPSYGVGGSTMRDVVSFYNGSIRSFPTLPQFLVPISQVLGAHPEIRINQLSWQATDELKTLPKMPYTAPRNAPPVKALTRTQDTPGATPPEDTANPQFAGGRYEIALLEGNVRVRANDFRGALDEVERLAADIGKVEGFRADVVESPLDVSPGIALQGRHGEREAETMEPRFVLRIVRERRPAGAA